MPFEPTVPPNSAQAPNGSPPRSASRSSARITALMNSPCSRQTPMGNDTAWALKLKETIDTAARQLGVQVISAKPVATDGCSAGTEMTFELDTDKGPLQAIRHKTGAFTFSWK